MLCRLCLKVSECWLEIFDFNGQKLGIADILQRHFWFLPEPTDTISSVICRICWLKVNDFHQFYLAVEQAHSILSSSEVKQETVSVAGSGTDECSNTEEIKEEYVEFQLSMEEEIVDENNDEGDDSQDFYDGDEGSTQPEYIIQELEEKKEARPRKGLKIWTDSETRQLLDKYAVYLPEIGPLKRFRTKKDMWMKIAQDFSDKSWAQCEERYKTLVRRQKATKENNSSSGAKRQLERISLIGDSIEPMVQKSSQNCITKDSAVVKGKSIWSEGETRQLLDTYADCLPDIGPSKRFRSKKDMWMKIAQDFGDKTWKQCEERYKTVLRRSSGEKRQKLQFEEELDKISLVHDSIEPAVQINSQKCIENDSAVVKGKSSKQKTADNEQGHKTENNISNMERKEEIPSSCKLVTVWSEGETRQLLDTYADCLPDIGPSKRFRSKKDMWMKIAQDFGDKTWKQCEERYKTVLRRKKAAIENNSSSGAKRQKLQFEEELERISLVDDSIEPAVQINSQKCIANDSAVVKGNSSKQKTVEETLIEVTAIKEEAKERRHQEKMEIASRMENLLQELLNKN